MTHLEIHISYAKLIIVILNSFCIKILASQKISTFEKLFQSQSI